MNYFAHGFRFVDRPYFMLGTAVPDLLGAINRRVRARKKNALEFVDDCDPTVAEIASGIVRHHDDDQWFHTQPVFVKLSTDFAVELRERLGDQRSARTGFLGHILVELMMDAVLIQRQPSGADAYYAAVASVNGDVLEKVVNRITVKPVGRIQDFLAMFLQLRFLEDYANDERLLYRINQVFRRIDLAPVDYEPLKDWFPGARARVTQRISALLPPI